MAADEHEQGDPRRLPARPRPLRRGADHVPARRHRRGRVSWAGPGPTSTTAHRPPRGRARDRLAGAGVGRRHPGDDQPDGRRARGDGGGAGRGPHGHAGSLETTPGQGETETALAAMRAPPRRHGDPPRPRGAGDRAGLPRRTSTVRRSRRWARSSHAPRTPPRAGRFFAWVLDGATPQEREAVAESIPKPVLKISRPRPRYRKMSRPSGADRKERRTDVAGGRPGGDHVTLRTSPPFRADHVGSLLRPRAVARAPGRPTPRARSPTRSCAAAEDARDRGRRTPAAGRRARHGHRRRVPSYVVAHGLHLPARGRPPDRRAARGALPQRRGRSRLHLGRPRRRRTGARCEEPIFGDAFDYLQSRRARGDDAEADHPVAEHGPLPRRHGRDRSRRSTPTRTSSGTTCRRRTPSRCG